MAGSTFGNIFKMTTWGESHGEGLGVVIDGVPAGITVDTGFIQAMMDRMNGLQYTQSGEG